MRLHWHEYGFMGFIAYGIGSGFQQAFQKAEFERVLKILTGLMRECPEMMVSYYVYGDDEHSGGKRADLMSARDIVENIPRHYLRYVEDNMSLRDICAYSYDSDWSAFQRVETVKEYEAREAEENRQRIEKYVGEFARSKGVKGGTIEFVQSLRDELDRAESDSEDYENPERQAEEWMDHRYAGATEYYHENVDYTRGKLHDRIDALYEAWEWLGENCPLLMSKYHETVNADE